MNTNRNSKLETSFEKNGPNGFSTLKPGSMLKFEQTGIGEWARKHITSDVTLIKTDPHGVVVYDDEGVKTQSPDAFSIWNQGSVLKALFIRLLLIGHNVLAVWRVVKAYDDQYYWILAAMNALMIGEGIIVVAKRRGMDYKWWCPCFMIYLSTTIPSLWLLMLAEYHRDHESPPSGIPVNSTLLTTDSTALAIVGDSQSNTSIMNITMSPTAATSTEEATEMSLTNLSNLADLSIETWLVLLQQALIYLLVFCRWLLPKKDAKQEVALLLLEFLAIASDIMEFLAVFDIEEVRSSLSLTYAVMTVWTLSFVQFVPSLSVRGNFRHVKSAKVKHLFRACGDDFVEILGLCMGIFLQDGPFLVMRLYIMVTLNLFTYSLVFFVLKNIVTVLLLSYRLVLLTYKLPCCVRIRKRNKYKDMLKSHYSSEKKDFS